MTVRGNFVANVADSISNREPTVILIDMYFKLFCCVPLDVPLGQMNLGFACVQEIFQVYSREVLRKTRSSIYFL